MISWYSGCISTMGLVVVLMVVVVVERRVKLGGYHGSDVQWLEHTCNPCSINGSYGSSRRSAQQQLRDGDAPRDHSGRPVSNAS